MKTTTGVDVAIVSDVETTAEVDARIVADVGTTVGLEVGSSGPSMWVVDALANVRDGCRAVSMRGLGRSVE